MSFVVSKGASSTFSTIAANKLSFVSFEGDPSRSKKKHIEKAVRVQAAKASAAARKATIARKEAAKLTGRTNSISDEANARGKEITSQETYGPTWQAHDGALSTVSQCSASHVPENAISHGLNDPHDSAGQWTWVDTPSSAVSLLANQAVSREQSKDNVQSQMWHSDAFMDSHVPATAHTNFWSGYPESAIFAASNVVLPDWYHVRSICCSITKRQTERLTRALQGCNDQDLSDAQLLSSQHVYIPQLQQDNESPSSSTSSCSPVTPASNDYFGTSCSNVDSWPCTHNNEHQIFMSSRLLDAYCLMEPPLFNLFNAIGAYKRNAPCAASDLRQLLHQANTSRPSDETSSRMNFDHANSQNYIWSGLLSYANCLCEADPAMFRDDSVVSVATLSRQLCYETATVPTNLPLGSQYDGVLLWSMVSRCMLYHNIDMGPCEDVKTLLRNTSIRSFDELKRLMIDFAYHPTLLDDRLAALWAVVAAELYDLNELSLLP
nr:hypothetical protein CFP56_57653 [Quercus suber]